ncbi:hypothetical protein NCLIV_061720 [Neospora caninum Liverpool]|uniref:Acetyl-CoA carboxylase n=1 Tax=Neospora caninum (strain Liverpool) TaxID=572307 RepID=F0VPV0_NEOCL|nr:hypothetical protein NCLIV_061720 [Neospora caninum Liverpool]CBZ55747.1 hypothetical protein NCLIV_061720 [Neospora caninum Liverpool]CEL70490.1 TPA: Acetyl-CoA carboxylase [Neospora caninum Liverpool]|eukprot:XP_003885773.1 hypothetical protein NCLIV_061720 [Neospora caninum Liverpool]
MVHQGASAQPRAEVGKEAAAEPATGCPKRRSPAKSHPPASPQKPGQARTDDRGPWGARDEVGARCDELGVKRELAGIACSVGQADSPCTVYSPSLDGSGERTQSSDHSFRSTRVTPESGDAGRGGDGQDTREETESLSRNELCDLGEETRERRLLRTPSASSGASGASGLALSDEVTDGEEEDVLAAFVKRMGGSHVIRRILIANNGTAAVRCIRSMRHWAYEALGDSKALEFVVMATAADIDANAEFIAEADFYVEVPPGPNSNNYANLHLIVQTAETYECDAVWPGWGHASENHRLPAILRTLKRKTIWIGPSPQAMLALGDKIGSAIIAQSVNVPCVPWSGMDVTVDLSQVDPTKGLSQQTLEAACVQSAKDVLDCCAKIGYPVMIKASEGGGGKGIRRVAGPEEVADAYRQVVNEVKGSPVFVMRMVSECRHLEVQLLADKSGRCVSLGSRDCSIQRRCQKIIEEGPVVAAPPAVVRQMEDAACRMAMAVGYENAGTCEFLYDPNTHQFAFLEVNARLQVEHVVTECVGDFNLPAAQLQVAMGILIDDIPDIKAYLDTAASNKPVRKHIIAARITAEHAEESFRPTVGLVHELTFRPSRFVWGYFSIGSKGNIHAFNDAQFGHLFAHGKDRREAVKHMVLALKDMTIRGELRTNVEALIKILEHPDFVANATHTTWLEEKVNFSSESNDVSPVLLLGVLLAAVFESYTHFRESEEAFVKRVEQGQLPPSISVSYESCLVYRSTKFTLQCTYGGQNTVCVALNDSSTTVHIRRITSAGAGGPGAEQRDGGFLVRGGIDGKSRKVYYKEDSTGLRVSFDGTTYTFTTESDPTQVRPPVSGKLVRWLVANEQNVVKGQSYAEIEIMKMYMQLHVEASGKLMHAMSEGAVFQAGDLLATLELPPGVTVPKATPFRGGFPSSAVSSCEENAQTRGKRLKLAQQREEHQRRQRMLNPLPAYRASREQLVNALDGYQIRQEDEDQAVACFFECILNPMLPISEVKEVLAVIDSQLPELLTTRLRSILADAEARAVAAFGLDEETPSRHSSPSRSSPQARRAHRAASALSLGPLGQTCQEGKSGQAPRAGRQSKLEEQDTTPGTPDGEARPKEDSAKSGRPKTKASKARSLSLASHLPPFLFSFPPFALELPVDECFAAVETQLALQAGGVSAPHATETSGLPEARGAETPHSPPADHAGEYVGVCVSRAQLQPLFECLTKYERGLIMAAAEDIARLLEKYLEVEELFEDSREGAAKSISMKRTEVDSAALASLQRSHQALKRKNRLLARLFEFIRKCPVWQSPVFLQRYMRSYSHFMESLPHLHDCLQRLSTLGGGSPEYSAVSLPARQLMLIKRRKPLEEQVRHVVQRISYLANSTRLVTSPTSALPEPSSSAAAAAAAAAVAASAAAAAAAAASAAAVAANAAGPGAGAGAGAGTGAGAGPGPGGPSGPACSSLNAVGACRSRLAAAAAAAAAATAAVVNLSSPSSPVLLPARHPVAATPTAGGAQLLFSGTGASPVAGGGCFFGSLDELLWDFEGCPDNVLMCLFLHPNDELKRCALQLYISRHYGRHGLHEMRIHTAGEVWEGPYGFLDELSQEKPSPAALPSLPTTKSSSLAPAEDHALPGSFVSATPVPAHAHVSGFSGSPAAYAGAAFLSSFPGEAETPCASSFSSWSLWGSPEVYVQRANPLLAVWTHHAVLTQEFLTETLDQIKPAPAASCTSAAASPAPPSRQGSTAQAFSASSAGALGEQKTPGASSGATALVGEPRPPSSLETEEVRREPRELAATLFRRVSSSVDLACCPSSLSAGKKEDGRRALSPFLAHSLSSLYSPVSAPVPSAARPSSEARIGDCAVASFASVPPSAGRSGGKFDDVDVDGGEAWEALGRASKSRLRHILTCFGGGENDETGRIARSQQTVAMVFDGIYSLENDFVDRLVEYARIHRAMPPPPPTVDGKILQVFILDLGPANAAANKEAHCCSVIAQLLNEAASLLQSCNLHLVAVTLLSSSSPLSPAICGSTSSFHLSSSPSSPASARSPRLLEQAPEAGPAVDEGVGCAPLPSSVLSAFLREHFSENPGDSSDETETPRYFYFRNCYRLPTPAVIAAGRLPGCSLSASPPNSTSSTPSRASSPAPGARGDDGRARGDRGHAPAAVVKALVASSENDRDEANRGPPDGASLPGARLAMRPLPPLCCPSTVAALSPCFEEEDLIRNTSHAQFSLLELSRFLPHFHVRFIPTSVPDVHVFKAVPKPSGSGPRAPGPSPLASAPAAPEERAPNPAPDPPARTAPRQSRAGGSRYFVRILVTVVTGGAAGGRGRGGKETPGDSLGRERDGVEDELDDVLSEQERRFVCGLNALEVACKSGDGDAMAGNHLLLSTTILFPAAAAGPASGARPSRPRTSSTGSVGGGPAGPAQLCSAPTAVVHRVAPGALEAAARKLVNQYERRLAKMNVKKVELRYMQRSIAGSEGPCVPLRLVVDNPTGQSLRIRKFLEVTNPTTGEQVFSALANRGALSLGGAGAFSLHSSLSLPGSRPASEASASLAASRHISVKLGDDSDFDGRPVNVPHPLPSALDVRRAQAFTVSTVFIYDFLDLFEEAIRKQWRSCPKYFLPAIVENTTSAGAARSSSGHGANADSSTAKSFLPERVFEATELRLNRKGELEEVQREKGLNECGMVAWRVTMYTPEFPKGRRVILIGNDVTFQMGTFGVTEDLLFQRASEIARKEGIPRIYIAVNSGARMGLANEVLKLFQVEWIDENQPHRGFKFLYVTEKDYQQLMQTDSIVAEPVQHPVEGTVYKITTIVGAQIGLGVENLCGSGAIAGETARAYKSTFTITFCSGRSVGIGAYLTRLGQRVIQKSVNAPLLLTGYQALNRLIGRDVYSSNDEIGGTDVMHKNGVSHLIVKDDIEGCEAILDWLSYVPEHREGPLPIMVDPTDPVSRPVAYKPARATEDPRLMFTGCIDPQGNWLGGVFDRGSYREAMADWARSVIIGRARLGGIPVGIVAVETRVTEAKQPADPAMPHTSEILLTRAGQVWFPDSAYKTAQAIWDFNQEELPLFIFANWRGFSGGQRDMFNEVLKFGAYIVDALVDYKQPCFVYIPPKGELRGGSWVVVDSRLNAEHMEMYADTESRGGVMEPSGTVEIKFRDKMLIDTMRRLDRVTQQLEKEDAKLASEGLPIDAPRRQEIKEKKEKRIQDLLPVYKQVAIHFADMHDTATRMKKRDAVHDVVVWEKSRNYFYWRLRRQLILFNLRKEITIADPTLTLIQAQHLVFKWAEEAGHNVEGNYQFVQWACHSISFFANKLAALRSAHQMRNLQGFAHDSPTAFLEILRRLDPSLYHRLESVCAVSEQTQSSSSTQRSMAALSLITKPNAPGDNAEPGDSLPASHLL